jgi:hypothetical protein
MIPTAAVHKAKAAIPVAHRKDHTVPRATVSRATRAMDRVAIIIRTSTALINTAIKVHTDKTSMATRTSTAARANTVKALSSTATRTSTAIRATMVHTIRVLTTVALPTR